MLCEAGVELLGFPLRLPVHREDLSENAAKQIISQLKAPHAAVLITYLEHSESIDTFCQELAVDWVQLHGDISIKELETLRATRPDLTIIKSLVVRPDNAAQLREQMIAQSAYCDYFITDTFDPSTGASGATGKTHDWRVSCSLVQRSTRPLILAGGLRPDNVREAILAVKPAGVDAHTGVEGPDGRKDPEKVRAFLAEVRAAYEILEAKSS